MPLKPADERMLRCCRPWYKLDDIHVINTKEQVQEVEDVISRNFQLWTWWRQRMSFRIQEVWEGWRSCGIGLILASKRCQGILPCSLTGVMKGWLGTSNQMMMLNDWVVADSNTNGVLYLVGDAGVGKTTIAMDLYDKCCHRFDNRAAIMVSSMRPKGDIIEEILDEIKGKKRLWPMMPNGRYLVLIDGVVSEDMWNKIKGALLPLPAGSKTIVTTRLSEVASSRKEEDLMHMPDLGEKEAKHIFMAALGESAGGHGNIPPRVWEMCVGHRLAMVVMAGYAACHPHTSVDEWKQVCKKLLPDFRKTINRNSVPRILSHCYHGMSAEVRTCCLYLSMYPKGRIVSRKHLARRWMAEGFVVKKPGQSVEEVAQHYFDTLVKRKMIQPVQRSNTGKVKSCRVDDLVHEFIVSMASGENLVTVLKQEEGGATSSATTGGRVRRLSFSIDPPDAHAANADDAHQQSMDLGEIMSSVKAKLALCVPRGNMIVSPQGEKKQEEKENKQTRKIAEAMDFAVSMSHVRSLALFVPDKNKCGSEEDLSSLLGDSPIVQVLDLEGWQSVKVTTNDMDQICSMVLLKYLSLRKTDTQTCINTLGSNIKSLQNLQTLDVRETNVEELPTTIWELPQLVNILGGNKKERRAIKVKLPKTQSHKKNPATKTLRVLSGIEIDQDWEKHLKLLSNLRKLAIYKYKEEKWDDNKSMLQSLDCHGFLQTLVIMGGGHDLSELLGMNKIEVSTFKLLAALELSGKLMELPNWISQLVALTELTLPITVLHAKQPFEELSVLKNLMSLTFSDLGCVESSKLQLPDEEIIVPAGGFDNLNLFQLFTTTSMPPLSFVDDAMPSLEKIHLHFNNFQGLHGIHNLHKLQEVHLEVKASAGNFTKSILHDLLEATRRHDYKGPRIIHDYLYT